MNKFLNGAKKIQNFTYTENGASALKSTGNACVDAFGSLGAMRTSDESTIIETSAKFFKSLLWLRRRLSTDIS